MTSAQAPLPVLSIRLPILSYPYYPYYLSLPLPPPLPSLSLSLSLGFPHGGMRLSAKFFFSLAAADVPPGSDGQAAARHTKSRIPRLFL